MPANEQAKFKHFIGLVQKNKDNIVIESIEQDILANVGRILGKDASGYQRISLKTDPSKSILVGLKKLTTILNFILGQAKPQSSIWLSNWRLLVITR